jgi:1-deoxy-D-xylulose 5-phosphate reductoisomerase
MRWPRPTGTTAVLNAANEVAVAAFLDGRLRFDQIHAVNHATLQAWCPPSRSRWPTCWPLMPRPARVAGLVVSSAAD